MGKSIVWRNEAKAQLRAIDQAIALRILHALARLMAAGEGDVKRLQDIDPPEFRLRVGDYRGRLFARDETIEVLAIKHRRDIYRGTLSQS